MTAHRAFRRLAALAALLVVAGAAGASGAERGPGHGAFAAYLVGRFAASESDTRVAADNLLAALRADPEQPELLERAFLAALLDGRAEATRLARRLPGNPYAIMVVAGAEGLAGRWDRAEQLLRGMPRQGAGQVLQTLLLAWAQQGRGQTDSALRTLRPHVEAGRLRGLYALHAAMIADLAGRPRDAERFVRAALTDTSEPTLRLTQIAASILLRVGREEAAARLLERLAGNHDDLALAVGEAERQRLRNTRPVASAAEGMAEAALAFAGALRGQGAADFALLMSRLALRLRPGFSPALIMAADALADARQEAAALDLLAQIPAGDPLASVAALRRATLLGRLDRADAAAEELDRLAAAFPDAPQPHARLGDILRARGRFAEAAAAYDRAIARLGSPGPRDWALFYARGIARERSGEWPRAEADFKRALELSPEQPYVLNYLGYSWVEQGRNLDEARRMLERAVQLRPDDGNIADSLGWALFKLGDLRGAVHWLERAVELEPRNSVINDHLGDAYWAAGRRREAEFQWRRALALGPEPGEAPKIEAKLREGLPAVASVQSLAAPAVPPQPTPPAAQ
ncbi:tetratricopeptide repeat protein [Caldovatus aquaticus]|uniref:Tetratricopeptide repeat protein n=1 Tax=Caldovatus aquaticus TaxID=2865671 RepID=A0ABS7F5Y5_9PROT|nr:tetratricopeptide repeat protein [Caldovatus aquaticus]MBW8271036.1 tetratricopeptide repeat protein [Caldovatus aquaticus]